jgi:hypothetical protein
LISLSLDSPLSSIAETICTQRDVGQQVQIWRVNNADSLRFNKQWLLLLLLVELVGN